MARIYFPRPISSASYARPKSVSKPNQRTHRASRRSSRADRFPSRFSALSTFASVSVTEYPRLPSDFRPAPFRFPPHERILSFLVDILLILYHDFEKANRNMNKRLSKEKQALVLSALCEGAPIEACARMFKVGTNTITRIIRETGEAFADYMDANFHACESSLMSNGNMSAVTLAE
jgi:hypothetical protein